MGGEYYLYSLNRETESRGKIKEGIPNSPTPTSSMLLKPL